jgi:hypothetical protein
MDFSLKKLTPTPTPTPTPDDGQLGIGKAPLP